MDMNHNRQGSMNQQTSVTGSSGRRYRVGHRRSPSELTPLMVENLAMQQQMDLASVQQAQLAAQAQNQQLLNAGMIPTTNVAFGQGIPGFIPGNILPLQSQLQGNQLNMPLNPASTPTHRRNQSAMPHLSMGPPPAPSSGAAVSMRDSMGGPGLQQNNQMQGREQNRSRGAPGGGAPGGGHTRRHSLALPEARRAAELAQSRRTASAFQFPLPGGAGAGADPVEPQTSANDRPKTNIVPNAPPPAPSQGLGQQRAGNIRPMGHMRSQSLATGSTRNPRGQMQHSSLDDMQRRFSNGPTHSRTGSRNFDGDWRAGSMPNTQDAQNPPLGNIGQGPAFRPGHRARNSIASTTPGIGPQHISHVHHQSLTGLPGQGIPGIQGLANPIQTPTVQSLQNQAISPAQLQSLQSLQNPAVSALPGFQFGNQQFLQLPQILAAQMLAGQNTLAADQFPALQQNGQMNAQLLAYLLAQQGNQPQQPMSQQNQQPGQPPRKTLFTPYLAQHTLPKLFAKGELVAGILRVNRKNRSDAYVTTPELDADIFICGSKDRNRALEGDLVAVELLDVEEVWGQKREKEEKKRRKDMADARSGHGRNGGSRSDNTGREAESVAPDGSIRRRGSLRQRPTQKKNDDVEVEGQSLLLVEEDEISDSHKPLYAGHIVAVIERVPGQMFSGTLGLLRPSSQATKEKQEVERQAREGNSGRKQHDSHVERPKIVWFKPTDKRVPLIAIPTEQAPADFVVNHKDYANSIFVASIKRWPITSLHPFGTLIERLGLVGDLKVETDALLRDNNFASQEFSEAVMQEVDYANWSVATESPEAFDSRRDFRNENIFALDIGGGEMNGGLHIKPLKDGKVEIGVHVADVAYFVKPNTAVDKEARKRGTSVYLMNRVVDMLPAPLSHGVCALLPGEDRFTVSVVFTVDTLHGTVEEKPYIGKGIVKTVGAMTYDDINMAFVSREHKDLPGTDAVKLGLLRTIAVKLREKRFGLRVEDPPALNLLSLLDDQNVPVQPNVYHSTPAHEMIQEIMHKTNELVAKLMYSNLPHMSLLRRQPAPNARRLQTFVDRMTNLGYKIDATSSGSLQTSLFQIEDDDIRESMQTLLIKCMQVSKYYVSGSVKYDDERPHYTLNLPLYTHFVHPTRRYADLVVHRMLETLISNGAIHFNEEYLDLVKTVEHCNNRRECGSNAQEQSVHIESCRAMDKKAKEIDGDMITIGVVLCVYESAFDVYLPEYGFEKRVHCDQLPLRKAEFNKDTRVLELYWEKGVPSSSYVPEDERPRTHARNHTAAAAAREAEAAHAIREREEASRNNTETGTISTDAVDALFDDDEEVDDIGDSVAGVSLGSPGETQSSPTSPAREQHADGGNARSVSDNFAQRGPSEPMSEKDRYLSFFKLREADGEHIQDVIEMTRVPIILKTDMTKSPPCLTIRSMNPYAL